MKKNHIVIISIIVVAVIVVISLFYPPADKSNTAGTIGMVNKYHKSTTSQKDIVLQSEFLKDTTALKRAIHILDTYEKYLSGLNNDFVDWESSLKKVNVKDKKLDKQLGQLRLLIVYMNNNLSTVKNTRELMNKYYKKDTADMSIDVDNNLIQFRDFTDYLAEKSKVVDSLFVNLNGIINKDKLAKLAKTKKETEALIGVREKILGSMVIMAVAMGDQGKLNLAMNSRVMNAVELNSQMNKDLGALLYAMQAKNKLGMFSSAKLNMVFAKTLNSSLFAKSQNAKMQGKDNLNGIMMNASLAAALNGRKLGLICDRNILGMSVVGNKYFFASKELGNKALGVCCAAKSPLEAMHPLAMTLNNMSQNFSKQKLGMN